MEENYTKFEPDNEEQMAETTLPTASDENTDNDDSTMQPGGSEEGDQDAEQQPMLENHPPETEQEPRDSKSDDEEDHLTIPDVLPVLPLKDTIVYPFAVQPLAVGQERSVRLIDEVMRGDRLVVLVAQKSSDIEQAGPGDIFKIGTVSRVARMIRMPDGTIQIIVQGLERVSIGEFTQEKPYLAAHVTLRPDTQEEDTETEAMKRNVIGYFQRLVALVQTVPQEVAAATLNLEEARQVVYVIATFLQMDLELRQKLLELDSVRAKLQSLSSYLIHELEILELGKKIQNSAQEEMGKLQREYLLREQLKAIQRELGEESEEQATINELRRKIDEAKLPEEAMKEANRELSRLEKLPAVSPEYSIIRTYLELLSSLPWSRSTGEKIDVPRARQVLDQDHYDLEKIKDRILEYLAVRRLKEERMAEQVQRSKEMGSTEGSVEIQDIQPTQPLISQEAVRQINREPILCFVGPPGVGKTSLGQSIARALGRKFARMSLGGIRTAVPTSEPCLDVSYKHYVVLIPTIQLSCWMKWTRLAQTGVEIPRQHCWRYWTRNKTIISAITTWIFLLIFPK
jgi:ATP-dependent Lon protease